MRINLPNFYVNYKLGNLCFQHEIKLPVCSESGPSRKIKAKYGHTATHMRCACIQTNNSSARKVCFKKVT